MSKLQQSWQTPKGDPFREAAKAAERRGLYLLDGQGMTFFDKASGKALLLFFPKTGSWRALTAARGDGASGKARNWREALKIACKIRDLAKSVHQ